MTDEFGGLENMIYSGRGIFVGATPNRQPFVAYTLTGRSPSSQARRLVQEKDPGFIKIEVTDEEQLKKGNPKLLIYNAIMPFSDGLVASNGAQTIVLYTVAQTTQNTSPDKIISTALGEQRFIEEIDVTTYEPDAPNFTPRIAGCVTKDKGALYSVRKQSDAGRTISTTLFELREGEGYGITTYKGGNENPLLSYSGDPIHIKITSNDPADIAANLYSALRGKSEEDYRVSVAVSVIDLAADQGNTGHVKLNSRIINRK